MAIARDNYRELTNGASFSYTNTAGDFLAVGCSPTTNSASVTGVTYNGVSMTQEVSINTPADGNRPLYIFSLKSPATGANTLTVSLSSGDARVGVASYTGTDTTTQPDDSDTATTSGTGTVSITMTSSDAGTWAFSYVRDNGGSITDGTNYTCLGADSSFEVGDSNGTTGSGSVTVTAGGPANDLYIASILIKPAASSAARRLMLMGVGV